MIDIFGTKITALYDSKGETRPGFYTFNTTITNGEKSIDYTFYMDKGAKEYLILDCDGFREPKLSEKGLHEALSTFVSEALDHQHRPLTKALNLSTDDLQMIEDGIIRKYLKPRGILRSNV